MDTKIKPVALCRHWVHSHEEDTGSEMVFRPDDFTFPPSRGRREIEIRSDGTLVLTSVGPVDRPQKELGSWLLKKNLLFFLKDAVAEPQKVYQIISVEKDRLVVKK